MKRGFILATLFGFLSVPTLTLAHSTGASFEKDVGLYRVDIGYDSEQIVGGDRVVFDFNLGLADAPETNADYDYVWVRLQNGDKTLLATAISKADVGATTLLYTLPQDARGELTLSARFQKGSAVLAESDFSLPVTSYEDEGSWRPFAGVGLLGAAVGIFASFVFMWWKNRRRTNGTL